ncbi:hypothetical protein SRB521_01480 [Intestinimonas butyriciproducens]|nr:hypothetical protein SRB521_01480 [Intestinimonas butyriciproducens]
MERFFDTPLRADVLPLIMPHPPRAVQPLQERRKKGMMRKNFHGEDGRHADRRSAYPLQIL